MTEDKKLQIEHDILDLIDQQNGRVTQTELANNLRVSIGLVNSYLKRLVTKGFIKVINVKASTVKYMLTPEGFSEKYRLTRSYMTRSLDYYIKIKQAVEQRIFRLKVAETRTVVFVGACEISEIMHLYLGQTRIKVLGVFDDGRKGDVFFKFKIRSLDELFDFITDNKIDKVLINKFKGAEKIEQDLLKRRIKQKLIEKDW